MPYVIAAAFLIFVGLGGGLNGGLAGASVTDNQSAGVADTHEVSSTDTTKKSATKSSGSFWNINNSASAISSQVSNVYQTPFIETKAALDIEDRTANLRGVVDMYSEKEGVVFFVYGYNLKSVRDIDSRYHTYEEIPESTSDKVRMYILDRRASGQKEYNRRISNLTVDTTYYFKVCVEYNTVSKTRAIKCGTVKTFNTNERYSNTNRFLTPRATANRAFSINADSATLEGTVAMNDGINGITFFVYGQNREAVSAVQNKTKYSAIDELDEDLQKARAGVGVRGNAKYQYTAEDLDGGELYYYQFCVEYDGERDGLVCSGVRNFTTDKKNRNTLPYVETTSVLSTYGNVALTSLVQMNDFNDGIAFLVVGNNQKQVQAVSVQNSFSSVRQSGYSLQKIMLDNDADRTQTHSIKVDYLENGTYWYRTCVQYENEDDYNRLKTFLKCEETKTFVAY